MSLLMSRQSLRRSSLPATFLACLPFGCGRQPPPEETASPAPVKWMEARQFFLEEWTELLGTTQALPDHAARITAPVEGRVVSVLQDSRGHPVAEGQHVTKGDVIVQLDARIARANRDKIEAGQEELKQQVQQAEYAVKLADIELRRLDELIRKGSAGKLLVAPIEVERARVALDDAKSKRKGAELRLVSGEKELKALDEQLQLYTLTAPINGRLGRLQVVPGQTLTPGTLVADVLDLDTQVDVLCFVPPSIARRLRVGQPARIGGSEEQPFGTALRAPDPDASESKGQKTSNAEGRVEFIADQAEMDTGNFAVKVRFPNSAMRLRGNMTLRLRALTTPGKAALTLPESAVMEDQDPPTVLVVEDYKQEKSKEGKDVETGKVRKLRVRLGIRDRVLHLVEVLGLDDPEKKWQGTLETAKFIVEKGQGLRNGDPVKLEVEDEGEGTEEIKN